MQIFTFQCHLTDCDSYRSHTIPSCESTCRNFMPSQYFECAPIFKICGNITNNRHFVRTLFLSLLESLKLKI